MKSNIFVNVKDLGKKVYRKKTIYTLIIEQDVLASSREEADDKLLEGGGINHSEITKSLTEEKDGVETYMIDANYNDGELAKQVGEVAYEDDEYAEEDGMVEIKYD